MGARLTRGTAIDGVIAYQDDADPAQFHYLPARAQCILGDTLDDFSVSYWGINEHPYYVDLGGGDLVSSVGGILAGQARIDISATQRANIVDAIRREFQIEAPRLLPLIMSNIKVQPVFAKNVVELTSKAEVDFPDTLQLGQSFIYNVSAGNSLFATLAAGTTTSPAPRADFGINLTGDVEFVGDPWEAKIECDLSQVYHYARTQVSASVSWGWFRVGSASYEKIAIELEKKHIIKVTFKEGSAGSKEGREMFETVKKIFEKINEMALNGDGFFKFEPNPAPQGPVNGGSGSSWPWSFSLNGSYSSTTFQQSIKYEEDFSYSGRQQVPMGAAMVLSVGCGQGTSQFFSDFQNLNEPCLNQSKLDGLQKRLSAEAALKQKKVIEYLDKFANGDFDEIKYRKLIGILNTITFTEEVTSTTNRGKTLSLFQVNEDEISRRFTEIENLHPDDLDAYIKKTHK